MTMAYPYFNNYGNYPMYQPAQDQLQALRTQQQPIQSQQDDRIYVQGELSAQAYLVAPNSFVRLWDSQSNTFFEKRADASGRPYMEAYEYHKKVPTMPVNEPDNARQAIDYTDKINALERRIKALEMKGAVDDVSEPDTDDSLF